MILENGGPITGYFIGEKKAKRNMEAKPIIEYLIVAENAIRDINGKSSIIGIFNNITKIPLVVSFSVVGRLVQMPPREASLVVRVFHPDTSLLQEVKLSGPTPKDGRLNIVARFQGVELREPGKYVVKVFLDDTQEIKQNTETYFIAGNIEN